MTKTFKEFENETQFNESKKPFDPSMLKTKEVEGFFKTGDKMISLLRKAGATNASIQYFSHCLEEMGMIVLGTDEDAE